MSMARLFVEADLAGGIEAPLSEGQAHYLRHVMRRADGAPLLLFNGRDGEWRATLSLRGKKGAAGAGWGRPRPATAQPPPRLFLPPAQRGPLRFDRRQAHHVL